MTDELEPLSPSEGREMYLDERKHEVSDATLQSHGYRLTQFVRWCNNQDIDNLNDISGRDIHRFRVKRREEDGLATATMKGQLATLRMFFRFSASIDAVDQSLENKIILPTTTAEDARHEMLSVDRAQKVLSHLDQFEYASLGHALIFVLWSTGLRIGATVGLDMEDYDSSGRVLVLRHRPKTGTQLKNGDDGKRHVALRPDVVQVLDDWIQTNHPGTCDDHGRSPLFATEDGRLSRNHARALAYRYTRPCEYDVRCPHDRDIDQCEAKPTNMAYACPSSISPHPIRRGSITHHLQEGTPKQVVSDRMNVGTDTLDRHYDERSAREKANQRRKYLPGGG